jgi:hypothetical protein
MSRFYAAALVLFVSVAPAAAVKVGNFDVEIKKDPFGEADRYVASTEQSRAAFFVRCLNGKVGIALGVYDTQPMGTQAAVKLRTDDGPIIETMGKVVSVQTNQIMIQTGDLAFVETLAKAKTVAVKYQFGTIGAFYTFKLKSADKVVAGVKKACRITAGDAGAHP